MRLYDSNLSLTLNVRRLDKYNEHSVVTGNRRHKRFKLKRKLKYIGAQARAHTNTHTHNKPHAILAILIIFIVNKII